MAAAEYFTLLLLVLRTYLVIPKILLSLHYVVNSICRRLVCCMVHFIVFLCLLVCFCIRDSASEYLYKAHWCDVP